MPIFQIDEGKVKRLDTKETGFRLERELHQLFEDNLEDLLGVVKIASEYVISAQLGRIDTLGIDENNSPVIIEYKLNQSDDVLDQGIFYYKWLNENRPHFNLLVQNKLEKSVDVNWERPRLILIAQNFGRYTVAAAETMGYVDLIRYSLLRNNILFLDKLTGTHTWKVEQAVISSSASDVDSETLEQSLEKYLHQTKSELHQPFLDIREHIISLNGVEERIHPKVGITYYAIQAIARFEFKRNSIDLLLKAGASDNDPENKLRDIQSHGWGFPYLFKIESSKDFEYAQLLIDAAYSAMR